VTRKYYAFKTDTYTYKMELNEARNVSIIICKNLRADQNIRLVCSRKGEKTDRFVRCLSFLRNRRQAGFEILDI
jgi:hypothetical protein